MARPNTSRSRIIEAAIASAAADGVSATTMDAIAERAGVSKGSLYYNFAGKDELFAAAFTELGGRVLAALAEAVAADAGCAALRSFVRTALALLRDAPDLAAVLPSELMRTDRPWNAAIEHLRGELVALARRAMAEARPDLSAGDPAPDASPSPAGASLFGARDDIGYGAASLLGSILLVGSTVLRVRPDDDLDAIADGLVRTLAPASARR